MKLSLWSLYLDSQKCLTSVFIHRLYQKYCIAPHQTHVRIVCSPLLFEGEFVGVGGSLDYDKHYPRKEFQLKWIREYLGPSAEDVEVERLQVMVDRFSGLPHLMWGTWALIQSKHSNIDFDFLD